MFLSNPAACESGDDFQYGEKELKSAVEGTWNVSIEPARGGLILFTVRLEQASAVAASAGAGLAFPAGAGACTNRTLVKSAGACVSITEMPLTGEVTEGDAQIRGQPVTGQLFVPSLTFIQGELSLRAGLHNVSATLSSDGVVSNLRTTYPGDRGSMIRIARPPAPVQRAPAAFRE